MVQQVLQRFNFTYSSPEATPPSTRHSLSALPSDESVEPSGPYPELAGCLIYLMTCTRPDLAYPLSILARYVAPGRHRPEHMDAAKRVLRYLCSTSGMGLALGGRARVVLTGHADSSWVEDLATLRLSQGYTFCLCSGSVSWQSTRSSSVLSSSCEAEIYAGAMAAQELRWLTYLLTNLGEAPRSPPILYIDNKAMLALCHKHRLEHRTKHIALCYFLARELHQRGQLRLAYVATRANTADIFTKALQPCDHQRYQLHLFLRPTIVDFGMMNEISFSLHHAPVYRVHDCSRQHHPTVKHYHSRHSPQLLFPPRFPPHPNLTVRLVTHAPVLRHDNSQPVGTHCFPDPTDPHRDRHLTGMRCYNPRIDWTTGSCIVRIDCRVALPRWQSPQSSTVHVNAITMKRAVALGAGVYESYEYTVMQFKLTNVPTTFQMTMNETFRTLLDKFTIVYLGDILVYSRDKQQCSSF
ncbi:unnamed protein product [Closterium sp. NIES-54]